MNLSARLNRFRNARTTAVLLAALFLGAYLGAAAPATVTLAWNPSSDKSVAGYNVYYGGTSRNYTNVVPVNIPGTNAVISGLMAGATYYFTVTAWDTLGVESAFSSEISYFVPAAVRATLQASRIAGGMFRLTIGGIAGHTYQVQASTNLVTWTTIATQTMGSNGSFSLTDSNAPKYRLRFYRAAE